MSATGLPVFDATIQKTHLWLNDLMYELGFPNDSEVDPEEVIAAVFKVLSDRVPGGEIDQIIQILPRQIRQYWPPYSFESLPKSIPV